MPRVVDHDQRRRELAEATLRVIVRHGMAGATVRSVAAEAGWSTGALRYYFASQDELRMFAAEVAWRRLRRRIEARITSHQAESAESGDALIAYLAGIVDEVLPLDDERREEYALWLALSEWERSRGGLDATPMWAALRALFRDVVAVLAGKPRQGTFDERVGVPDPDPLIESWAEFLHVLTDGLASQAVLAPYAMPADQVRSTVRSFLREIAARFHPDMRDRRELV